MNINTDSSIDFVSIMKHVNQYALTDLIASPDFNEWFNDYLYDHTIVVEFTKKNGEKRKMRCTRNTRIIPENMVPKNSASTSGESIRVFDLDINEWRSFIPSSITSINWGVDYNKVN